MAFLKTVVLLDIVKIVPTDHDRTLHLHLLNNAIENSTSDAHVTGKGAFFVNVAPVDGLQSMYAQKT